MIRDAGRQDVAEIALLWNHAIRETLVTFNPVEKTEAEIAAILAPGGAGQSFLVAIEAGRFLGFARSFQFRGGAGYARTLEHTILLAPEARGHGLGRALMDALCDRAREGGAHSLWAGVSSGNPGGRAFHAALGFEEVAVLAEVGWKFERWWDLTLMRKRL